jgi:hypothetical protein
VAQTPEALRFKSYSFKPAGVVSFCLGANLNRAVLTFRSPSGREIRHGDQILRMEVSFCQLVYRVPVFCPLIMTSGSPTAI